MSPATGASAFTRIFSGASSTAIALVSKFTAPLVDTPKTVQVITEEVLQQTGATSLQEALKATPGITFGNGEGGNPTGDQAFIRGMDAQASTFVDGMRDIAAGSREVFNLEAIEVIKGADSASAHAMIQSVQIAMIIASLAVVGTLAVVLALNW